MTDQNTRPQPSAEPVAVWREANSAWLSNCDADQAAAAVIDSALEAARREALEQLPDEIDIYRAMKSAQSRKLIDLARAVAALLPKENTNG